MRSCGGAARTRDCRGYFRSELRAEDARVERAAERTVRIELVAQRAELVGARPQRADLVERVVHLLAPVRACTDRAHLAPERSEVRIRAAAEAVGAELTRVDTVCG